MGNQVTQPYNPYNTSTEFQATPQGMPDAGGYAQAGLSAVSGAAGIYGDIKGVIDQERNMNIDVTQDLGGQGRPQYGLTDELEQLKGMRTTKDDVGKGLIGRSTMSGATAGAAAGSFFPGLGTLIGAGVGAIGGFFGGLFGKKKAKKEREKNIGEFEEKIAGARTDFNEANRAYGQQVSSGGAYRAIQQRKQNRLYNIPSYTDTLT